MAYQIIRKINLRSYPNIKDVSKTEIKSATVETLHSDLIDLLCVPHPDTGMIVPISRVLQSKDVSDAVKDYLKANLGNFSPSYNLPKGFEDMDILPSSFVTNKEYMLQLRDFINAKFNKNE